MTLLVDENGGIAKMYDADHWILPLSKRVYLIVGQNLKVLYRKDMGFALLPDQTQTLITEIDRVIR